MTIDEVEEITGIDFYPALPDDVEEAVESKMRTSDWNFTQFTATGETADPSQFDYVSPDTPLSEKVLNAAVGIFVELKTEVFSALGVTEIAKAVGLM